MLFGPEVQANICLWVLFDRSPRTPIFTVLASSITEWFDRLRQSSTITVNNFKQRNHLLSSVNLANKPEKRFTVLLFRTAIARAFRCPINSTNFLPRADQLTLSGKQVAPVPPSSEQRQLSYRRLAQIADAKPEQTQWPMNQLLPRQQKTGEPINVTGFDDRLLH